MAGWPVTLLSDVEVETNEANVALIEADRAEIAYAGNFIAASGAPVRDEQE